MPGRTRFLSIDVDVALAPMTRMRADSSALWPVAAHRLHETEQTHMRDDLATHRS
jgi:hypothetical protein